MLERAIMAGFGGQGLMFMGKLVVKTMMDEGLYVTYFPSYGAEVRGGTANCHIVVSSDPIAEPIVDAADTLILMNQPSYDKFRPRALPGGAALVNTSLIQTTDPVKCATVIEVPATQMAADLGDVRVANMVMLGVYNVLREFVSFEKLVEHMRDAFGQKKANVWELNAKAIEAGRQFAAESLQK